MFMERFVENVGRVLIGYQIQNVLNADILFRQILIWVQPHFARIVQVVNVIWIL